MREDCLLIVYGGVQQNAAAAKSEFGVDEYLTTKVTLGQINELLCKHLRMGWSPVDASAAADDESGRFRHPMAGQEMVSARVQPDDEPPREAKKKGFFSRLFGS